MARRRVGAAPMGGGEGFSQYSDPEDLKGLLQLAGIESLNNQQANPLLSLVGTSQEPRDYTEVAGVPEFQDIRQNKVRDPSDDAFIENYRRISQIPLIMSESDELNQDALENLEGYKDAGRQQPISQPQENMQQINTQDLPRTPQGQLQDPLEFIRSRVTEDPSLLESLPEETRAMLKQGEPVPEKPFIPEQKISNEPPKIIPPDQPITENDINNYANKGLQPQAVEEGMQDQQIMADLARLNGLKEIPKENLEQAAQWQAALTKRREELTDDELMKVEKAESGNLSTMEKVFLGIAVAIPVLIALRYGSKAGIAAAGGGLKGFGTSMMEQEKSKREKETELSKQRKESAKEKLQLEEKSIDVNKKLLDSIPDRQARDFLKDKKIIRIGDKIGISTGDEKDALWFDGNQLETSEKGIEQARKYLDEAKEKTGLLNKSNVVIDEVLDVLDALPDSTGVWEAIKSNYGWFTSAGGKNPFGAEPVTIDIKDKNGNVRKVNAFEILKQKMGALQDVYNRVNLARAALTSNVMDHWAAILGDPKSLSEWFTGQNLQTVKDKTESLKEFLNAGVTEQLVGNGFLREPLEKNYPTRSLKPLASKDTVVKQIRANPEAYRAKAR